MGNSNTHHALCGDDVLFHMFDLVRERNHVLFVLSEETVSDMIVYNNLATSIQYVYILYK